MKLGGGSAGSQVYGDIGGRRKLSVNRVFAVPCSSCNSIAIGLRFKGQSGEAVSGSGDARRTAPRRYAGFPSPLALPFQDE